MHACMELMHHSILQLFISSLSLTLVLFHLLPHVLARLLVFWLTRTPAAFLPTP